MSEIWFAIILSAWGVFAYMLGFAQGKRHGLAQAAMDLAINKES